MFFRGLVLIAAFLSVAGLFFFDTPIVGPRVAFAQTIVSAPYSVSHLAGGPGGEGYTDGIGLSARFNVPSGVWGVNGSLYVADSGARRIRKVDIASGTVTTIATLDQLQCTGPTVTHNPPTIFTYLSVWADSNTAYIADDCLHVIYAVTFSSGNVTVLSGQLQKFSPYSGTPPTGPATQVTFLFPTILWGDASYLYVKDATGAGLLRVDRISGQVSLSFTDVPGCCLGGDGTYLYTYYGVSGLKAVRLDTGSVTDLGQFPSSIQSIVRHSEAGEDFLYVIGSDMTIRRIRIADGTSSIFAGVPTSGSAGDIGGWKDGPGPQAEFNNPWAGWADNDNLYVVELSGTVRRINFSSGIVSTLAGEPAISGRVDGSAQAARFTSPKYIWGDGNYLYITDGVAIRRVRISDGQVSTVAGGPVLPVCTAANGPVCPYFNLGMSIDGIGATARFNAPSGIWGDGQSLYIADNLSCVIRKLDIASTAVTTIAGVPNTCGTADGPAAQARLSFPTGLWGDGTYLYVADGAAIRRVGIGSGEITTIAGVVDSSGVLDGVGSAARFLNPRGIWGDGTNLYIAEQTRICKLALATGQVTTLSGGGPISLPFSAVDATGTAARFGQPAGIWSDGAFLYVSDLEFHSVRRIQISDGSTTTIAGTSGRSGADDQSGLAASFNSPMGIWGDGVNLYVADMNNYAIRSLTPPRSGAEPSLVSITPPGAPLGTAATFTITGSNFVAGDTVITVNGPGTQVTGFKVNSSTSADVTVQIAAGTAVGARTVRAVQTSGISNPVSFDAGTAPDLTKSIFAIPGGGAFSAATTTVPGAETAGYARIVAGTGNPAPSGLAIFGERAGGVLISEAAVPATATISAGRFSVDCTANTKTGIAIVNPNDFTVKLTYTTAASDGSILSSGFGPDLQAGQQVASFIDQYSAFTDCGPDGQGTMTFTASAPVAAIALRGFVNQRSEFLMSTLPITDLSSPANKPVVFPHLVDGAGWASRIVLTNPTVQPLAGQLQFINPSGAPLSLVVNGQTGSTMDYSIPAGASQTFLTGNASTDVRTGWIRMMSSSAVYPAGNLVFSYTEGPVVITEAAVAAAAASSAFRLYVEKDTSLRTGVAIANPGTTTPITFTDLNGVQIGQATSSLPANTQTSMFVDEFFHSLFGPSLPDSFRGVLRISTAGAGVNVIGLRIHNNERGEFLMSTAQPVDETASPNPSELFFPHFVESGGFSTQFILFPDANVSVSGTLEFFSQSGQPLNLPVN